MKIIKLDTVDSTNSEALRRLPELENLTVISAREQTSGRGQRGNSWFSAPGENLTFSIVLKFCSGMQLKASEAHFLNYLISDVLADYLASFGILATIKWPNDIYVGKNKIAGILIENSLDGEYLASSVIGVGLNVNQEEFPNLVNATSIWRCCGEVYDLDECLKNLLERFESFLPCIFTPEKRRSLFSNYSQELYGSDHNTRFRNNLTGEEFWGKVDGVDPTDGRLRIQNISAHRLDLFYFQEVSYIL
ncbi:MAG: biotin--[Bacteroidales bacterium]|nr:biotin--[acetyl-CoA-carboxylase] ligase [Bacteroidales bacterium]